MSISPDAPSSIAYGGETMEVVGKSINALLPMRIKRDHIPDLGTHARQEILARRLRDDYISVITEQI